MRYIQEILWIENISIMERSEAIKSEKFGATIEGVEKEISTHTANPESTWGDYFSFLLIF